jgi:hypothetical protein
MILGAWKTHNKKHNKEKMETITIAMSLGALTTTHNANK